ncbi:MAG: glycosyltransferase [Acidimicrobiales bacterium]
MTAMQTTDRRTEDALRVRVVVLNWNSAELTRRCVRSLLATDYPADALDIVVVDNGSIDGSVAVLRRLFPQVRIQLNGENLGFGEGCNRAMRDRAGVDAIALVNNDATVEPGWLWPLVDALRTNPGVGAVSPKLLFATEFVTVTVDVGGEAATSADRVRLLEVHDGDLEIGAKVLPGDGVANRPHQSIPLRVEREIATTAELHVPVTPASTELRLRFAGHRPLTAACGGEPMKGRDVETGVIEVTVPVEGPRHRRINNLGTGLTEWTEGVECRYGEPDDPTLRPEEVLGWCGGGVLLRSAYLDDSGLFDPRYFAYYEDTDVSWRGRHAGWITLTEPSSVLHHVHGGSAGSSWPGFFYLNYRNWLLTTARNGNLAEMRAAVRTAWRISWPYVRHNVVGPVRRLRRPDLAIASRWARVLGGLAGDLGPVLWSRRRRRAVGTVEPTGALTGWLQPPGRPRAPVPRPGGPVVCYVDVTETLRSGWRAGIQRVVTELTTRLLLIDDDLELVPICWSPLDRAYRRLDPEEMERLFAPAPMKNHPPAPPPASRGLRAVVGPVTRTAALRPLKEGIRRQRDLARRPDAIGDLVLERFERGAVFLDLDATWNLTDAHRGDLLPRLRDAGVHVIGLQHDLLPDTDPDWFDPNLVRVFRRHLRAHVLDADLVLCNSEHTRSELEAYCRRERLPMPATEVLAFGGDLATDIAPDPAADTTSDADTELIDLLADRQVLLSVGTIEPRKNQAILLDVLDRLGDAHPDLTVVLVGRQGWHIEAVAERIRRHPLFGTRLLWPDRVTDATLRRLYEMATLTVIPSLSEGFGLPVLEALGHGSVVLSSNGGALPEAGADAAEYFDPGDLAGLCHAVEAHLTDAEHHAAAQRRVAEFVAPTWDATAAAVADAISAVARRTR